MIDSVWTIKMFNKQIETKQYMIYKKGISIHN